MVNQNQVRCVNKKTNKVRYFSKDLANNALWRKNTGFEICDPGTFKQTQSIKSFPEVTNGQPPIDTEAEIQRRVKIELDKALSAQKPVEKPKRKYTKKLVHAD